MFTVCQVLHVLVQVFFLGSAIYASILFYLLWEVGELPFLMFSSEVGLEKANNNGSDMKLRCFLIRPDFRLS